jgi:hypothetical protein
MQEDGLREPLAVADVPSGDERFEAAWIAANSANSRSRKACEDTAIVSGGCAGSLLAAAGFMPQVDMLCFSDSTALRHAGRE